MFETKSVTSIELLNEYIFMTGLNVAVFLLVTDTTEAGTAGFAFLLPFSVVGVLAAIWNTIRITFFLDLQDPGEQGGKSDGEKQFTRGWLGWMAGRIKAVSRKFVAAGAFSEGGAK